MSSELESFKKASFIEDSEFIFNDYWNEILVKGAEDALSYLVKEIYRNIKRSKDERAFVLVSAILIENVLDNYLIAFIPGYGDFRELREITFSTKIELAKSLRFTPTDKLNALDIVRKIRNQFAHHIPITRLEDIDESHKQSIYDNLKKFIKIDSKEINKKSTKVLFEQLVLHICTMLIRYSYHIDILNAYIRSNEIFDVLEDFFNRKKIHLFPNRYSRT